MRKNRWFRTVIAAGAVACVALSSGATEASNYPPGPTTVPERSLDVNAFAPVCQDDVPFIEFNIVPVGFGSTGPATLRIFDVNGNFVEEQVVTELSGRIIYPGAEVNSAGVATDYPGFAFVDGEWVIDTSDEILRDGLSIEVEVNPTATATVGYPPATSACNGPENPGDPDDPSESSSGVLPSTGSNTTMITLLLGAGLLGAGIMTSVAMRRRHASVAPEHSS